MICQLTQHLSNDKRTIDRYYLQINRPSLASGDSQTSFTDEKSWW